MKFNRMRKKTETPRGPPYPHTRAAGPSDILFPSHITVKKSARENWSQEPTLPLDIDFPSSPSPRNLLKKCRSNTHALCTQLYALSTSPAQRITNRRRTTPSLNLNRSSTLLFSVLLSPPTPQTSCAIFRMSATPDTTARYGS